jgi:signal transduction histidine kinase
MSEPIIEKRLGLFGMKERVEMLKGTFTLESAPGKGTTVKVEVPFGD